MLVNKQEFKCSLNFIFTLFFACYCYESIYNVSISVESHVSQHACGLRGHLL